MGIPARRWLAGIAVALYLTSLLLPTCSPFKPSFSTTTYCGAEAVESCWRAVFLFEGSNFEWWVFVGACCANLLIWLAVAAALAGWRRFSWTASALGVFFCLLVLDQYGVMIRSLPGYWVWLSSFVVLMMGSSVRWKVSSLVTPPEHASNPW